MHYHSILSKDNRMLKMLSICLLKSFVFENTVTNIRSFLHYHIFHNFKDTYLKLPMELFMQTEKTCC